MDHEAVPNFATGQIQFRDLTVLLSRKPSEKSYRLVLANHTYLDPHSEQVVDLRPTKRKGHLPSSAIVTPLRRFTASTGVYLGRSLVTPNHKDIVPAILINTSDCPVEIPTGFDIAIA
jgi:hypothetical protein